LTLADTLPIDAAQALLVGRAWLPGPFEPSSILPLPSLSCQRSIERRTWSM